jgi:carbamoylphosphate synthase large subunit
VASVERPTLYLVAPVSLQSWFEHFSACTTGDHVVFTGEGPDLGLEGVLPHLARRERVTVVLSSHTTLERDGQLADRLRGYGLPVYAQSRHCGALGTDKFRLKAWFDACGFPSPQWMRAGGASRLEGSDRLVVVKHRHGTQSVGTRLTRLADCALSADEFCELYVDGVEYSVLVYRDERGVAVFPPIWKGATSPDLVPPWRRLRLCPYAEITSDLDLRLRDQSRRIALAARCCGFMEVEYLVTDAGDLQVLEINPRVAGTMRIAAMACDVPIFAMHKLPELRDDVAAVRWAAEVPYSGRPFSDAAGEVFATSRLTMAAADPALLRGRLSEMLERVGA